MYYALYRAIGTRWNPSIMGKFETLTIGYRDTVRKCKADGKVRKVANVAWEEQDDDLSGNTPHHAALAAQLDSQRGEISSLRAEFAAQAEARNAEALAAEQQAQEKLKAHELRVSGAVDFLLSSGSEHSRNEALETVCEALPAP